MSALCPWCDRVYLPRLDGGSKQRFCSASCRGLFHTAARRWALAEFEAGRVTVEAIKKHGSDSVHAALSDKPGNAGS